MSPQTIDAGGVRLPVIATANGSRVAADGTLESLSLAINAYLDGLLPDLPQHVRAGEQVVAAGITVIPAPPGLEDDPTAQRWAALGGSADLDSLLVGSVSTPALLIPRAAFLDALEQILDVRARESEHAVAPGAPEEPLGESDAGTLQALERRAVELDAMTDPVETSARRRVLLRELEVAGVFDAPQTLPTLAAYHAAAQALMSYLHSEPRRQALPEAIAFGVVGAPVTLDYFRLGGATHEVTALGEWLLVTAAPSGGEGEFAAQYDGRWYEVHWRADDGVTPALLTLR